ncbi:hypothetical protein F2Q70_00014170 [Brassica cretica]|uniref:Uncharacterized protein n=1 Tax=Brassica cretica TaxID=69181 RepID=A0A3N6S8X8_BRACR|nr:hypothetical protein F2Q70_00014170 [Brassica cretica]
MRTQSNDVSQHFEDITMFIRERLSPTKLRQYMDLMKLFRSRLIEGDRLIWCLQNLFREDECLFEMFNKLMETEIREMQINEAMEPIAIAIEEGEIVEEHRRRCRINRVRFRRKIGRNEADLPIKKRSKYRSEVGRPVGPYEFKSIVNPNCGNI